MPGAPTDDIRACRAIARSKEHYADPDHFNPERFLKTATHEPETDPRTMVFGFGRRWVLDPVFV